MGHSIAGEIVHISSSKQIELIREELKQKDHNLHMLKLIDSEGNILPHHGPIFPNKRFGKEPVTFTMVKSSPFTRIVDESLTGFISRITYEIDPVYHLALSDEVLNIRILKQTDEPNSRLRFVCKTENSFFTIM